MKKFFLSASLIVVFLFSSPTEARNKNHEKALQSTFVLCGRSMEFHIDHHPLCTAFVYKEAPDGYFLLTMGHCFEGAPSDAAYLVAEGNIAEKSELQPVEVLTHVDDGKMDIAELHLKTKKHYQVLKLDSRSIKIDDEVFYVGYPKMVSQALYLGRVSSTIMQTACGKDVEDICKGRFLVQTGGGPGASGSPVISEKTGEVVGVLEGSVFENGVVVVPATSIQDYLIQAHLVNDPKALSETGGV